MKKMLAVLAVVISLLALVSCGGEGIYQEVPNYVGGGARSEASQFSKDEAYVVINGAELEDVEGYLAMLRVAGYQKANDLASVYVYEKREITVAVNYTYDTKALEITVARG